MKYSEVVPEVNRILDSYDMLLTLRQIYYRLVAKQLIPNTINAYKGLSKMLVRARERGEVDDSRIEDRSRQVLGIGDWGYDDFDSFLDDRIKRLKDSWEYWTRKMWEDQPYQVLLALEKDALSRLFTDVADRFRVHVFPTRGYGSYTYVKDKSCVNCEHMPKGYYCEKLNKRFDGHKIDRGYIPCDGKYFRHYATKEPIPLYIVDREGKVIAKKEYRGE